MTINSETRVAGPFEGNDSTVTFPFSFKVFDSDELLVVRATGATETVLVLGTNYSVALNPDQNASPGGSVTLTAPLASGSLLTLTSDLEYLQPLDLTNQGGFYPRVINNAFDRVTILLQQLKAIANRTLKFPLSDGPVGDLPGRADRAGAVLAFDAATGEPIAGPNIAQLGTVAGGIQAIAIVANNIDDVNTVADNIGNVNAVGGSIGNVNILVNDLANVDLVAENINDVNIVAEHIDDVTNFAGVYYGASATDPSTRRDGTPLQVGDLYFNTTTNGLRGFSGTGWKETAVGATTLQNFSGDGVTTEYQLSYAPESELTTQVFISGVYQQKNTYSLGGPLGDLLVFGEAPPEGVGNVEVLLSSLVWTDGTLRLDLLAPGGSGMVGYKGRTVAERLSDRVSIKDAPFSAVMDGVTDDSLALKAFCEYLQANGGFGFIPPGTLYSKTYRPSFDVTYGPFKPFVFEGSGKFTTIIKFGNISPVLNPGGTAVVTPEPDLFSVKGLIGVNPHPHCVFRGFGVDYSEQVFRGGATAAQPGLTDIKPLSNGCRWLLTSFGDGVTLEGLHANEIYGNGLSLFRSPYNRIKNCTAFNVSAGNIGAADSNGAFIILLSGSQVGTVIEGCRAINLRVYQTDTIAGFTDRTSKNTPCGYIGICVEYATNADGIQAPGTGYWVGSDTPSPNFESMGCTVRDCLVYGYYMGFKSESSSPVSFTSCTSLVCWMPFVISGSTGVGRDCYADRAWLDLLIQPMPGYRYVGGMYTHLDYTENVAKASGVVFDGCQSITRAIPVFSTNGHYGKFINSRTLMPLAGGSVPGIAAGRATALCRGVEVSGTVIITGTAAPSVSSIIAFDGLTMDMHVENKTTSQIFLRLEGSPGQSLESTIKISTDGLVCFGSVNQRNISLKHRAELLDTALSFTGTSDSDRFLFMSGAAAATVDSVINCHANATQGPRGLGYINGTDATVELTATLPPAAGTVACMLSIQGPGFTFPRLRKVGAEGTPMLSAVGAVPNCHVQYVRCADAPLFVGNLPNGPLIIDRATCPALSTTGSAEPNAASSLTQGVPYTTGLAFKYLRPVSGGREGVVCTTAGYLAQAWAATTAYTVGTIRKAGGRVYTCTAAGTSGAVAPSHTSGSATDGSVTWSYLGVEGIFVPYGSVG